MCSELRDIEDEVNKERSNRMIYLTTAQFGWLMGLVGFFSACTFCLFLMLYVKTEIEN